MKICYLADGQSIHTRRWCSHFNGLGHEIHLITFRPAEINGVHVHFIDSGEISAAGGNWKMLLHIPGVRKIIKKIRPDILHAMYATSYGSLAVYGGMKPVVVTALGSDVLVSPFYSRIYQSLLRFVFRKADWLTAMSDPMKETMISLGAKPEKITTVVFGIDTQLFHPGGNRPEAVVRIISTRNLEEIYDIPCLLKAFRELLGNHPNAFLDLVGDGTLRSQLEQMTTDIGIRDKVKFHGRIPQAEIARLLQRSNVFVSAARSDGNNISLNEAMNCGCYCIASDIPANRVWIRNGENGLLYPPGDHELLYLALHQAVMGGEKIRVAAAGMNERLISEKADWNANMKIVEEKYRELIKEP
ncbi:MAG: glycosyltransferase [Bacteroidia bacterium]|nr:glycosyltransferase [Bacteroidia bacterium]